MPGGGSKTRRGGRKPGTLNKVTADVRALAQKFGAKAIAALAGIMDDKDQPAAARVSAARELLDRAYGKAPQPLAISAENISDVFGKIMAALPG